MPYIIKKISGTLIETFEIPGPILRIGRGTANELQFDDLLVALDHAVIEHTEGSYILTDPGSETGTYVNESRVRRHQLADNDKIKIGPYSFRFYHPLTDQPPILQYEKEPQKPVEAASTPFSVETRTPLKKIDDLSVYGLSKRFFTKTMLSFCLISVILAVAISVWVRGEEIYIMPGEISSQHRFFQKDCLRCHVVWQRVSDEACLKCHDSPIHHENQVVTSACTTCHREHEGDIGLVSSNDRYCIQCHADLKTKDGTLHFGGKILSFNNGHPEFKVTVQGEQGKERVSLNDKEHLIDTAQIKLNHKLHLKSGLKSPKGPVQLACKDCHAPNADGMRMAPVAYQKHCKECHELGFDPLFPNRVVPHAPPEEVHAYLLMVIAEHRDEILPNPEPMRRLPASNPSSSRLALTPRVSKEVFEAETHLYSVVCTKCHVLDKNHTPFPKVEETAIPARWLPHSSFEHKAHRQMECASCHHDVSKSEKTADVLLPEIQTCQDCHQQNRIRADCVLCHFYHDKSKQQPWEGRFTIKRLLDGGDIEKAKAQPIDTEAQP